MTPTDRKYATTHEWVFIDNGIATVGITHYAQDALGEISYMDLPKIGKIATQGGDCCVIESLKAASDIHAPVGGTVCEVNNALKKKPELINVDPYGAGWIYKLSGVDEKQLSILMDDRAYDVRIGGK